MLPLVLRNVTIVGARMNVATTCPGCGLTFDATGGGDGTFSTGADGRLRLREAVFEASSAILSRPIPRADIEAAIQALRRPVADTPPQELQELEGFKALWQWMNQNPAFGYLVAPFIVGVLLLVLSRAIPQEKPPPEEATVNVTVEAPSEAELRDMVEQVLRQQKRAKEPPVGPATPDTSGP